MNIQPEVPSPEPAAESHAFLTRLHQDWASPKLLDFVNQAAPQCSASLSLENRLAFIGSTELLADLSAFAHVEAIEPDETEDARAQRQPVDLLLIEGRWPRVEAGWRRALLDLPGDDLARLRRLVEHYRERGTPTVLWVTDEADAVNAYSHLFEIADAVFVPAEFKLTGSKMFHLDPGVNVRTFNPFKLNAYKFRIESGYFRFLIDGAYELAQFLAPDAVVDLVGPLLPHNTWLVDSSYRLRNNNEKIHAVLRRRFLGSLDEPALAFLMRNAWGVFYPSVLTERRPAYFRKRALQAAACKSLVLTDAGGPEAVGLMRVGNPAEFQSALSFMVEDPIGLLGLQHLAWRDAVTNHTFFERLETIFAAVKVKPVYNEPSQPSINVVLPTIRPQLIPFALEMYAQQSYRNTHLTIVANGAQVPEDIAQQVAVTPNAKLCFVPGDKSVGYCMNFGIDQVDADYWAKWDDDDIYGPHYLEDQIVQRKYVDFDICGKGTIFTYLEERECLHIRKLDIRDTLQEFVGGGTLLVRNDGRYFPEDVRGFADTLFLTNASMRGDRVLASDPFNFVQVRRTDPKSHTWTAGAHTLNLSGPVRQGLHLDHVIF